MMFKVVGTVDEYKADLDDRLYEWFEYSHLKDDSREVAIKFQNLAKYVIMQIESGPERTVALRKLLEAKLAAVKATTHKGE